MMESEPDLTSDPNAIVIPNFREDERLLVRYDGMIERRKKTFATEHLASIRRNASSKRDDLREALDVAQAELEKAEEIALTTREAYRAAYPHHVKRTRLVEPTGVENLRSFGAANKLYRAAHAAWLAASHATSAIRKIEHNEAQLEVELQKALDHAPAIIADVVTSEKWLAEIHQEEELANVRAKVDEIEAERTSYAERLEAGLVQPPELRARTFARLGIKHAELSMKAVVFLRIDRFEDGAYFILRDMRKNLFALPYDRRLESLLGGIYDVNKLRDNAEVKPSLRDDGGTPVSLADHFTANTDTPEAAAQAAIAHRRFIAETRTLATVVDPDALESTIIEAFAIHAADTTS